MLAWRHTSLKLSQLIVSRPKVSLIMKKNSCALTKKAGLATVIFWVSRSVTICFI